MVTLAELARCENYGEISPKLEHDISVNKYDRDIKQKILNVINEEVKKTLEEAKTAYAQKKLYETRKILQRNRKIKDHTRLLAQEDIYFLREAYIQKESGENHKNLLAEVKRKSWNDYFKIDPLEKGSKENKEHVYKAFFLNSLTNERISEAGFEDIVKESNDLELLTYHLILEAEMKESKEQLEESFQRFAEHYIAKKQNKELRKKLDNKEISPIEFIIESLDESDDIFQGIAVRNYLKKKGNFRYELKLDKKLVTTYKNEHWLVYDYLKRLCNTNVANIANVISKEKPETAKQVAKELEDHMDTARAHFNSIPAYERKKTGYKRAAANYYNSIGTEASHFEKAKNLRKGLPKNGDEYGNVDTQVCSEIEELLNGKRHDWKVLKNFSSIKKELGKFHLYVITKKQEICEWFKRWQEGPMKKKLLEDGLYATVLAAVIDHSDSTKKAMEIIETYENVDQEVKKANALINKFVLDGNEFPEEVVEKLRKIYEMKNDGKKKS
ncbi:hypothetical protein KY312_00790 [Candidatus Woesearchaeota archaeon]|nr:hypothetical protein [Candidatus Woesearchaeota archaeon]